MNVQTLTTGSVGIEKKKEPIAAKNISTKQNKIIQGVSAAILTAFAVHKNLQVSKMISPGKCINRKASLFQLKRPNNPKRKRPMGFDSCRRLFAAAEY